jgi:hypothetical protein
MDWLKKNYDRAILALAALALIGMSAFAILSATAFPAQFSERNSPKPPDNTIKPLPAEAIASAVAIVEKPRSWGGHDGSLFVSRQYVLKDENLIDPLEGDKDLHPPIKNSWLVKYDLDYADADVKDQDPDEDRFSNIEEYLAGTDPMDKKSVPPYYTKLRLKKFDPKPFRLIFTGTPDEGQTFTINTRDQGGRTQFLQLGDPIQGAPYKLISYEKKSETRDEIERDISVLVLENTETGKRINLVVNQETNDPTSFGEFVYLYDNSTIRVKKDEEITLPPETDRKYKLIDISAQEAVIQDVKSGEKIKILPDA